MDQQTLAAQITRSRIRRPREFITKCRAIVEDKIKNGVISPDALEQEVRSFFRNPDEAQLLDRPFIVKLRYEIIHKQDLLAQAGVPIREKVPEIAKAVEPARKEPDVTITSSFSKEEVMQLIRVVSTSDLSPEAIVTLTRKLVSLNDQTV